MKTVSRLAWTSLVVLSFAAFPPVLRPDGKGEDPTRLLPALPGWHAAEAPRAYRPENLFEYINGAAEAYLSYDFKALAVGDYAADDSPAALTVEVYDMGIPLNAFGIYGAERYADSRFLEVGTQGYAEEGVLNFLHGRYYVKLLCFDCGGDGTDTLLGFARAVIALSPDEPVGFPSLLQAFPREGLVAHSEKFLLRNVLGFGFLRNGYLASYEVGEAAFDGFLVEASGGEEAETMMARYLEFQTRNGWTTSDLENGAVRLQGRAGDEQRVAREGRFFFGMIRARGVSPETSAAFLRDLRKAVAAF
ncbi:MAG: hypothetical protein JW742_04285 [Candidatus Aminicenantes bacterium]|nr:hypothetical protein [Candidatus Aminicenantes bacterium]